MSVILFFATREYAWDGKVGVTAEVTAGGKTETIECWESYWGDYYLFLPSYAELSQVRLRTHTRGTVHIDDLLVPDGMTCESLLLDEHYTLTFNGTRDYNFIILRSGNVPTMYLDTASGTMDHIHEVKGNEEPGTVRIYAADGTLDYAGNLESIKGRGNATWIQKKKPYSLRLYSQADLLGMGKAQNWILLANAYDYSNLRNKLAFDLAADAGMAFSPEIQWVDLYLNGEFAGLYMLCERNEVHPQRVDIGEEGSFLVSMELQPRLEEQGYPFVTTNSGADFRVHYADMEEAALQRMLQSVENAIAAEDGVDPITGKNWQELIDLDSWAKKYLLEEILGNYDAGSVSQYFYLDGKDADGKIYAGPVWDYDNTLGNYEWQTMDPQAILAGRPHITGQEDAPWLYALYQKDGFQKRVKELYRGTFRPLLADLQEEGLDQYAQTILPALVPNGLRWNMNDYEERIRAVRTYLSQRTEFLDSLWIGDTTYVTVQVSTGKGTWGCFAVRPGECLAQLPEYDSAEYLGWYRADTGEAFDIAQPVYEDLVIYLKPASDA